MIIQKRLAVVRALPIGTSFHFHLEHPKISTLFPYTTLFRSHEHRDQFRFRDRHHRKLPNRLGKVRSEEHTSELQSHSELVCRLLLEKKNRFHFLEPFVKEGNLRAFRYKLGKI